MFHKVLVLGENPPVSYLHALARVGIPFDCRFSVKDFSRYSGLLLTGGGDVLPAFYGGGVEAKNINFIRDQAEFSALGYFALNGLPVLAICRGAQVVNAFFGGTLKNVDGHAGLKDEYIFHPVVCNGSRYYISAVNSCHRQAVDVLGENAVVEIVSGDVKEGISFGKNVVALQFHPEKMNDAAIDIFYGEFAENVRKVSLLRRVLRRLSPL